MGKLQELGQSMHQFAKKCFGSGIFLALLSALMFALYSFWYQFFSDDISRTTTVVMRGLLQFLIMVPVAFMRGHRLLPDTSQAKTTGDRVKIWTYLTIVVVSGGFRLLCLYSALDLIESGTVTTILNGAPFIILLIGHCIFPDDKITIKKALCAVFLLVGVALNCQIDKWQLSGVTIALSIQR